MSYASRLIAESTASVRSTAPAPVARLDVDVIEEAGKAATIVPVERPAAVVSRIVSEPVPLPARADDDARIVSASGLGAVQQLKPQLPAAVTPSDVDEPLPARTSRRLDDPAALHGPAEPASSPPVSGDAPAERATDVAKPAVVADQSFHAAPIIAPSDVEGVPWRRLTGTDLAAASADASIAADAPALNPHVLPATVRASDEGPTREPIPAPRREPEMESVTLSIGSIEVIVDGGLGTVPSPVMVVPPPPAARRIDDPIMQMRRQYVTWPDGD